MFQMGGLRWNETELEILIKSFENGDSDPIIEDKFRANSNCWNRNKNSIAQKRRTLGLVRRYINARCTDPFQNILNNQRKAGFIKSV
jgi:hypothetical protein